MIGGLTRLTGSGLSMTGWEPITGWFPPISDAAWQEEFARYQQSPQYLKVNSWMGVTEFKEIFWLEFIHRLIGRIAGCVFLFPLIYFVYKRAISKALALRFSSIFVLGAVQATIGWLMVSSGLKDEPRVSQYWLAFHLSTAFVLFAILLWLALWQSSKDKLRFNKLPYFAMGINALIFLQVIMGAFVAGLHAGLIYNTFPLMDGAIIPSSLFPLDSWHKSLFEDVKTVQFVHRSMAYLIVVMIILFWFVKRKVALAGGQKRAIDALLVMVFVQFLLGVATLLMAVPVALASAHQMGALVLFAISLYVTYSMSHK